ncbi:hypothetical protein DZA29_12190 [Citrobacter gillenii]|nr:hypothetical protein DZA29_12190 [Citrobacter gillenii]
MLSLVYTHRLSSCICVSFIRPSASPLRGQRKRCSNRHSRFVLAHPSHVLMYAPGDSLRRRLDATRNSLGIS